ncbi:5-proFAR isomerase [Apiospora rasikravindrae]|uniref:1-(5-phosphoribosyl)-5-[(5-phosphoribosylamino)methylideneamino] imidazole-4-carboxamide isomerase n=1 Tax=Apiospora rasikravindrae TaxID=990691 RepID=A0ABR1RWN2_9PEZI
MTKFRPCIDLHAGQVKQIVGGTLDSSTDALKTNHVSLEPAGHFARLYRDHSLRGGHVIMLGPKNDEAATEALAAWPGACKSGAGSMTATPGCGWRRGPRRWVVECYLLGFLSGVVYACIHHAQRDFLQEDLELTVRLLNGDKQKLVIDLSCRKRGEDRWFVAMNKWQTITDMEVNQETIKELEPYCSEFLIHAADNEGLQKGIDETLVQRLAEWCSIPVTYAGGGRHLEDLDLVAKLSGGKVDLTIGSALDCFGGSGVKFDDCVAWNNKS